MSNLSLGAAVLGVLMLAGIAGNADYADAVLAEVLTVLM